MFDEQEVKQYMENETKQEKTKLGRGNVLFDFFSDVASDSTTVLNSVEAGVSRDMYWVEAEFKNVEQNSVERIASSLARELDLPDKDFVEQRLLDDHMGDTLNVSLQIGFEKFLDVANIF